MLILLSRKLDRKFSEQNIGAPPSYEEVVSESRSPDHSERYIIILGNEFCFMHENVLSFQLIKNMLIITGMEKLRQQRLQVLLLLQQAIIRLHHQKVSIQANQPMLIMLLYLRQARKCILLMNLIHVVHFQVQNLTFQFEPIFMLCTWHWICLDTMLCFALRLGIFFYCFLMYSSYFKVCMSSNHFYIFSLYFVSYSS